MKTGKIVTVIPSRLGSNRVPMKGMRLLEDKTLIEYTLSALKGSKHLGSDIYINSDSELWGGLADEHDVRFYHRRAELATSQSMIDDYLYDFMINVPSDYLAVITPTSPLLSSEDLDAAWQQYATKDADTLISAEEVQTHCFFRGKDLNFSRIGKLPRSQDLDPVIALNFTIAIYDCKKFTKNYENLGWGVFTGNLDFFILEGFSTIDIDEEKDFIMAELAMKLKSAQEGYTPRYSKHVQSIIESNKNTKT
jgi:CMP-N-acetylneuraminic acid synthetase